MLALTVTEAYASTQRGGRLAVPMVVELDEAANVCRWMELPDMYSHYGSRGIVVGTYLQSYSQGVEVWGRDGMRKLWSAATVRTYGGGVAEPEFLNELASLIGDYERTSLSHSESASGTSKSWSGTSEQILNARDLGAMPPGRIVVFASGTRPVLPNRAVPTRVDPAGSLRGSRAAPGSRREQTPPSARPGGPQR